CREGAVSAGEVGMLAAAAAARPAARGAPLHWLQDTEMKETMQSFPGQAAPAIKHKFKFSFDVRNEPPQIVSEVPAHIHCCEGEAVVLECGVSGQPPPSVTWSWNGQNLSASERLSFEKCEAGTHRLHIRGVSVSDAGLYCCVAKNVAGTAQSASELTVPPTLVPAVVSFTW
uniref:Ig-like domain-containing protein n=1 Tax=Phasianus colchicus TaxID=9054 RepID=A0A669Q3L4_PHACC